MHQPLVMQFRARKKHEWMEQKMCSKESAYFMEALEEINHYIKEKHAWRHLFEEINNNYIEEEITCIQTLILLSYNI